MSADCHSSALQADGRRKCRYAISTSYKSAEIVMSSCSKSLSQVRRLAKASASSGNTSPTLTVTWLCRRVNRPIFERVLARTAINAQLMSHGCILTCRGGKSLRGILPRPNVPVRLGSYRSYRLRRRGGFALFVRKC